MKGFIDPIRVPVWDPCRFGLPEILTIDQLNFSHSPGASSLIGFPAFLPACLHAMVSGAMLSMVMDSFSQLHYGPYQSPRMGQMSSWVYQKNSENCSSPKALTSQGLLRQARIGHRQCRGHLQQAAGWNQLQPAVEATASRVWDQDGRHIRLLFQSRRVGTTIAPSLES